MQPKSNHQKKRQVDQQRITMVQICFTHYEIEENLYHPETAYCQCVKSFMVFKWKVCKIKRDDNSEKKNQSIIDKIAKCRKIHGETSSI